MEIRSFNVLDVASRLCNEAKGRYANMWRRSSGGQSNNLTMVASEKERAALTKRPTGARSIL